MADESIDDILNSVPNSPIKKEQKQFTVQNVLSDLNKEGHLNATTLGVGGGVLATTYGVSKTKDMYLGNLKAIQQAVKGEKAAIAEAAKVAGNSNTVKGATLSNFKGYASNLGTDSTAIADLTKAQKKKMAWDMTLQRFLKPLGTGVQVADLTAPKVEVIPKLVTEGEVIGKSAGGIKSLVESSGKGVVVPAASAAKIPFQSGLGLPEETAALNAIKNASTGETWLAPAFNGAMKMANQL